MNQTMKTTLASLLSLALLPTMAGASYAVYAPFPGNVTATTYYSSGSFHGAVDISTGSCGVWGVETAVAASLSWNVTIRNAAKICNGSGSGNQNEVKHTFASGYTFRQWHFLKTADSVDKTCNRCQIGDEGATGNATGPHSHMQYDKSGTNNTAWYSGTAKGEHLDRTQKVGTIE